jgi:uncharacterized membrane protein YfcA
MDITHLILFIVAGLLCEIVGTVGGFGSSVFFVPIAGFFFPQPVVLGLTGILHVFSNISKLLFFGKHINWRIVWLFGISSVLMVIAGAWIATKISFLYFDLLMGVFLVLFSGFFLLYPAFSIKPVPLISVASGGVAGFLAGIIGTGGAVRGLAMAAYNLEKNVFVASSAAVDLGVDASRSVIYLQHDFVNSNYFYLVPVLLIISIAGSWMGKLILKKLKQEQFKKIVLWLILFIGVLTLLKYFFDWHL